MGQVTVNILFGSIPAGDADHMPFPVRPPDETMVIYIPLILFSDTLIKDFFEFPVPHQGKVIGTLTPARQNDGA
jgi:hypothetical protein